MASVPFSTTFSFQAKGSQNSSTLWPSMAFSIPFTKSPLGSSKSALFRNGFSLQSSVLPGFFVKSRSSGIYARAATEKSLYDFTVKDIDGKDVSLGKFKRKVLLIVNVASRCGLTPSNYSELSHLYEKYKTQGFEILAFPCNQFGGQEPGSNPEIKQFACTRFKAEFPIFDKVDVNGPNTAPVYQFLKSSAGGFLGDVVKWNFEKFLVDKNGKVVERYPPTTSPFQIEPHAENPSASVWSRCNSMDTSWLLNVVSKEIADSLLYLDSAHVVWLDLHDWFHQSNASTIFQIKHSLDVCTYYTQVENPLG